MQRQEGMKVMRRILSLSSQHVLMSNSLKPRNLNNSILSGIFPIQKQRGPQTELFEKSLIARLVFALSVIDLKDSKSNFLKYESFLHFFRICQIYFFAIKPNFKFGTSFRYNKICKM